MHVLAVTRFNEKTWRENENWRERNNWRGAAYGIPIRASESITKDIPVFVLEMHNDENKIKGIGLIRNTVLTNRHFNLYTDGNYNR